MQEHLGEGSALDPASDQTQDLSWLVTDFTERVPDVAHAVVVSSDGVPLAVSDGIRPDGVEHLSAVTSGLTSLAQGTARMFECGAAHPDPGSHGTGDSRNHGDKRWIEPCGTCLSRFRFRSRPHRV